MQQTKVCVGTTVTIRRESRARFVLKEEARERERERENSRAKTRFIISFDAVRQQIEKRRVVRLTYHGECAASP